MARPLKDLEIALREVEECLLHQASTWHSSHVPITPSEIELVGRQQVASMAPISQPQLIVI